MRVWTCFRGARVEGRGHGAWPVAPRAPARHRTPLYALQSYHTWGYQGIFGPIMAKTRCDIRGNNPVSLRIAYRRVQKIIHSWRVHEMSSYHDSPLCGHHHDVLCSCFVDHLRLSGRHRGHLDLQKHTSLRTCSCSDTSLYDTCTHGRKRTTRATWTCCPPSLSTSLSRSPPPFPL